MTAPLKYSDFNAKYIAPIKEAIAKGKKEEVFKQLDDKIKLASESNFLELKGALEAFKRECNSVYKKFSFSKNYEGLKKSLDEIASAQFNAIEKMQKEIADPNRGIFPAEIIGVIMGYTLETISNDPFILDRIKKMLGEFCRSGPEELRMWQEFARQIGFEEKLIKSAKDSHQMMALLYNYIALRDLYKLSNVEAIFGAVTLKYREGINKLPFEERGKAWLAIVTNENAKEIDSQEILALNNKNLTGLPGINHFQNLKILSVSNNRITALPEDIATLDKLQILDLHCNAIRKLPAKLKNLENLKGLVISGNPISDFHHLIDCLPLNLKTLTISEEDPWYKNNKAEFQKALAAKRPGVELWERTIGKDGKFIDNPVRK